MGQLGCPETSVSNYQKYAALTPQKSESLRRNRIVSRRMVLKWTLNKTILWRGLDDESSRVSAVNVVCENGIDSHYIRDISLVS
jgi:hypothetical protein